ncbi:MAG: hypothetical protein OEW60_02610 [Thiovulaceae bacterium]|nr:hypothetical protein [Sulfurimonadaceae bacterium]
MRLKLLPLLVISIFHLSAEDKYTLGNGYKFFDALTIGGYFTTDYTASATSSSLTADDIAVLAYGKLSNRLSYLGEFESKDTYTVNFQDSTTVDNFQVHIERLNFDYKVSEKINFRVGKQITPIGYWGAQPISVLRDTTSNPVFSTTMYPKLFTGIDAYGYLPFTESTKYHLLLQKNEDLDSDYNNILTDQFFAFALDSEININWRVGGSIGHFINLADEVFYFVQLNTQYDFHPFTFSAEIIRNQAQSPSQNDYTRLGAFYLQLLYRQSPKHIWVTRLEHSRDPMTLNEESFLVAGYSFRPLYPISLKTEYQWHEYNVNNKFILSFSVLF